MPFQLPPPITRALLIACTVLLFLASAVRPIQALAFQWLTLYPVLSGGFWPWQAVTYPLVHIDALTWFFNMLMLYFFGSRLEELWGLRRYIQFLLACTLAAAAVFLLLTLLVPTPFPLMGLASVTFGMLVAFGILFPHQRIMLYFVAEVTMRTAVWVFVGIEVIMMLGQLFNGSGAWVPAVAQLGGALGAWLIILYWRWRPPSFKRKKPPTNIRRVH
jgi:membrane associated rhomboid family serine protease